LEGNEFVRPFIAANDSLLISADIRRLNCALLAHLSEDEALINAFPQMKIFTAARVRYFWRVSANGHADMRRQAKVINFGILYGMSAFGLAKELAVSLKNSPGLY